MNEKVLGLTETKVQELVNKFGCILKRQDFVLVVSVEWLKDFCSKQRKVRMGDCVLNQDKDGNINIHPKDNFAVVSIKDLLEAVRLQVKKP